MNFPTRILAAVYVFVGLFPLSAGPVRGQDKAPAPSAVVVECEDKAFPNVAGRNYFLLKKEKGEQFTAVTESYGKPKTYSHLKCSFHSKDRKVFFCMDAKYSIGVVGERRQTLSLDSEGEERKFDGYFFEVDTSPVGDVRTIFSVGFANETCGKAK